MAKSQDTESLGQRIARLRREKGLTQAELAQRLQVSQPVVSDYENDVIRLPADVVVQIGGDPESQPLHLEEPAHAEAVGEDEHRTERTCRAQRDPA